MNRNFSYVTSFLTEYPRVHGARSSNINTACEPGSPECQGEPGILVSEYLSQWLVDVKARVSPKTFERYEELCIKSLGSLIGSLKLQKLKPIDISKAYARALETGSRKVVGGLAPRTVHHMHTVLKCALQQAVHWDLIDRNPAISVRPPRVPRRSAKTYDFEQTAQLLKLAKDHNLYLAILLAVLCGMRRGEIVALRWCDVDLQGRTISIVESVEQTKAGIRYKEPKSGRPRSLALSASVVDALAKYRQQQSERFNASGKQLSTSDRVVMLARLKAVRPDAITHGWVRFLDDNPCLRRIRFHDLRHTHATHLLASGVHPKVASERLGHAQVGITLDTYSHVLPNMQAQAAALVDREIFDNSEFDSGSRSADITA